jgi:hypothetical protein
LGEGDDWVKVFTHLHATRSFRRRHLPFLQTQEDHDIILEVGLHQERGTPLTLKQLQFLGITSIPTLQRRLRRLRELGAIVARRSTRDARVVELTLSSKVMRTYARYGELISRVNGADSAGASDVA